MEDNNKEDNNNKYDDNNKDNNYDTSISASGLDRDLGCLRAHQGRQGQWPHDDDEEEEEDKVGDKTTNMLTTKTTYDFA